MGSPRTFSVSVLLTLDAISDSFPWIYRFIAHHTGGNEEHTCPAEAVEVDRAAYSIRWNQLDYVGS
jgi:hypothetical protein